MNIEGGDETYGIASAELFQTKSLEPGQCRYVNRRHGGPMLSSGSALILYHGDLLLFREKQTEPREFVARFWEGKLQWIRDLEIYPANLNGLLGRGP